MKFKRIFLLTILTIIMGFNDNVLACGEINELASDVGKVSKVDDTNYLVKIPEGTSNVNLSGSTNYQWVTGFEPRSVSTNETVELKVNGESCGYGIYTYFVKFEVDKPVADEKKDEKPKEDNKENEADKKPVEDNTPGVKLKSLEVKGYALDFSPTVYEYNLEVDSTVDSLDIKTDLNEGDGANIVVSDNAKKLVEGENKITISVMDSNSNVTLYTLNVEKLKLKSNNNFLANITVSGYQLNFDASQTSYSLEIGKENALNISVVTESELASYEIIGNQNLANGSTVTIRVTAEDESIKDYVININKSFNIMDYWIYVVVGLLVILLIILFVILKQKKNKKGNTIKNNDVLGPDNVDVSETTAGSVETFSPSEPVEEFKDVQTTVSTGQAVSLEILEPSDVENSVQESVDATVIETFSDASSVDENNNPTEVFKL